MKIVYDYSFLMYTIYIMTRKKLSFIIFIILLVGVLIYTNKAQKSEESITPYNAVQKQSEQSEQQQEQVLSSGDVIPDSDSSPVVNVEKISLTSVDPRGGTGTATRSFDDVFSHGVVLDVADPAADKFYEGWLVQKPSLPMKFYSTGKLEKNEEGQYILMYDALVDEKAYYNKVVITEETLADGLDNKPETHIFEAQFTDR